MSDLGGFLEEIGRTRHLTVWFSVLEIDETSNSEADD